jgi:hypothetical protein
VPQRPQNQRALEEKLLPLYHQEKCSNAELNLSNRVETMSDLPSDVERLTERLETLERRVCALEHPAQACSPTPVREPSAMQAVQAAESLGSGQAGGVFSVLGKALLGIAGAYVLRAVAESSSLPKLAIAALAIVYAIAWLVAATQTRAGVWLASTVYACTSALILHGRWRAVRVCDWSLGAGLEARSCAGVLGGQWRRGPCVPCLDDCHARYGALCGGAAADGCGL